MVDKLKRDRCNKFLVNALNDPEIKSYLPNSIEVYCQECPFGGFYDDASKTIVICDNYIPFQKLFNNILKHEAIHAKDTEHESSFEDHCLFRACTEIRAAKHSGECPAWPQLFGFKLLDFNRCVYDRSVLATSLQPDCDGPLSVQKMWNICFNTTKESLKSKSGENVFIDDI